MVALLVILFDICFFGTAVEIKSSVKIVGRWNLTKLEAGFAPIEHFDPGNIQWEFKSNGEVLIDINISLPKASYIPFPKGGKFKYISSEDEVTIENITYQYRIKEDLLFLFDQVDADGMKIKLERAR